MVIIEMEDGKKIKIELLADQAPNTVANFKSLVSKGFYNGLIFHRVISGFMIQGGCPSGSGTGGPGYRIKGEFAANSVDNTLSHKRSVVSMARAAGHDTAGSQFFIVHQDAAFLDKQYAAFGRVTEGMDVVDAIAATPTDASDRPRDPQVMKSVTLTDDETVEEPEKM